MLKLSSETFCKFPLISGYSIPVSYTHLIHIKAAQNIVVVKCFAGMAQAACAAIDTLDNTQIVGSIAGDDTIFLAARDNESANSLVRDINSILHKESE